MSLLCVVYVLDSLGMVHWLPKVFFLRSEHEVKISNFALKHIHFGLCVRLASQSSSKKIKINLRKIVLKNGFMLYRLDRHSHGEDHESENGANTQTVDGRMLDRNLVSFGLYTIRIVVSICLSMKYRNRQKPSLLSMCPRLARVFSLVLILLNRCLCQPANIVLGL